MIGFVACVWWAWIALAIAINRGVWPTPRQIGLRILKIVFFPCFGARAMWLDARRYDGIINYIVAGFYSVVLLLLWLILSGFLLGFAHLMLGR
jgi:hypothetical protein